MPTAVINIEREESHNEVPDRVIDNGDRDDLVEKNEVEEEDAVVEPAWRRVRRVPDSLATASVATFTEDSVLDEGIANTPQSPRNSKVTQASESLHKGF